MAFDREKRNDSPMKRRGGRRRKKVCVYCADKNVCARVKALRVHKFHEEEKKRQVISVLKFLYISPIDLL